VSSVCTNMQEDGYFDCLNVMRATDGLMKLENAKVNRNFYFSSVSPIEPDINAEHFKLSINAQVS
jgi:hypothetical protein